jgi:hypothetical protein
MKPSSELASRLLVIQIQIQAVWGGWKRYRKMQFALVICGQSHCIEVTQGDIFMEQKM